MKKFLKFFLFFSFITFILLEVGSGILLRLNLIQGDLPSYSLSRAVQRFWVETDPHFGVWHDPNSTYRHIKSCFDVTYQANSMGMRDEERQLQSSQERIALIGDSLIEGWGVEKGKRLSDLLEKANGREYLNFGTAGYFGSTQYYLMYKYKVKDFNPNEVILGIYPFNDFIDDNYELWKNRDRYRPFWVGQYPDYQMVYTKEKPDGVFHLSRYVTAFLKEWSHLYNAVAYVVNIQKLKGRDPTVSKPGILYSGFYDFTEEQYLRLQFSLEKLLEELQGKKLTVLLIPAPNDFARYQAGEASPLTQRLQEFSKNHPIQIVDMLSQMQQYDADWKKYFFTCDEHLNAYGNQAMFEVYEKMLRGTASR